MFPKAPEMTPTLLPASPGRYSVCWVGRLLGPADLGNVIVLREHVQVSVKVLHSLLVGFGCFLQDPFHLSLLLHLLKGHLGWGPLVEVVPQLLSLVLLDFAHRFQEFCLVFVLFLLLLGHAELCDSFQLQGSLLDLLIGVHAARLRIQISKWTKVGGQFSQMEIGDNIVLYCRSERFSLCRLTQMNTEEHLCLEMPRGPRFRKPCGINQPHHTKPWRVVTLFPPEQRAQQSTVVKMEFKGDPLLSQGL